MDAPTPPFISRLSFALYNALAGHLILRAVTPPTPIRSPASSPTNPKLKSDSQHSNTASRTGNDENAAAPSPAPAPPAADPADRIASPLLWAFMALARTTYRLVLLYTSLVALLPPPDSPVTPDPPPSHPLNATLLTWNAVSVPVLAVLGLASYVRVRAYGALGADFTYELRRPSRLVTAGMYRYVRHPSYSAAMVVAIGSALWYLRMDGAFGGLVPVGVREVEGRVHVGIAVAVGIVMSSLPFVRVRDEEKMMRERFGSEWDEYCKRTWKMVPLVW